MTKRPPIQVGDKKNNKKEVNSKKFRPYLPRPHKGVEKLFPVA